MLLWKNKDKKTTLKQLDLQFMRPNTQKSAALIRQIQPLAQMGGEKKTTEKDICHLFPDTASFPEDKAKKNGEKTNKSGLCKRSLYTSSPDRQRATV